jgi:hypothetical protein
MFCQELLEAEAEELVANITGGLECSSNSATTQQLEVVSMRWL